MRILLVLCFALIIGLGFYAFGLRSDLDSIRAAVQAAQEAERKTVAEVQPLREQIERLSAERARERAAIHEIAVQTKSDSAARNELPAATAK